MTKLYVDVYRTTVVFKAEVKRRYVADEPAEVVITVPLLSRTEVFVLTLDDVERLAAVCDTALHPVLDLAEFFEDMNGVRVAAVRAAEAFDAVDWHLVLEGHAAELARQRR